MSSLVDRRRLMRRAWHLFRTQLGGPGCILRNHPRDAMRAALCEAWREEKAIAAAAAMGTAAVAARLAAVQAARRDLLFCGNHRRAEREAIALAAEIRTLEAAAGLAA